MTCGSAFFQANEIISQTPALARPRKRKQASRTPNAIARFRNPGEPEALRFFDAFFQASEIISQIQALARGWRKRKQASRTPNAIASFRNPGEPEALRFFDVHAIARNVWSA